MAKRFLYGLRMRPASIGAVPPGFHLVDVDKSNVNMRHGAVSYEVELTDEEVKRYELVPLTNASGGRLQSPLLPHAVLVQVKEAVEFFAYLDAEGDISARDIQDEMVAMAKRFEIFIDWSKARRINWADAIGEMGGLPEKFFEQIDGQLVFRGSEGVNGCGLKDAARASSRP